jgi:Na+/proline symporter
VGEAVNAMEAKNLTRIFNTDVNSKGYFIKQIIGGAFITIAMTGLDQEMMQKNISVKNLKDSQKNMLTFSVILVFVNLLFLLLGGLLYLYAYNQGASFTTTMVDGVPVWGFVQNNLNLTGDNLFPSVALGLLQSMPSYISVIFIIALISALFPSADGALTALTSSFCIDILGIKERTDLNEKQKRRLRLSVHLTMTTLFFICILVFREINSRSIIDKILDLAGYTYGPLLGLFTFGILTRRSLPDNFIIAIIALVSPVLCYLLQTNAPHLLNGYVIGIEILIINGLLTFTGLLIISKK